MRRVTASLSALLVVQLGVALLLLVRRDPLAGARLDTPLLSASSVASADQLIVAGPASGSSPPVQLELDRKDGQWILPGQFGAPADASRVSALLDRLAALKRGLPVATSEASLRRFKLVDGSFERRIELRAGGKTLDTLYLGESAGLRKTDARSSADRAVYAVDVSAYELPTDAGSWLNANLLRGDATQLAELDLGNATGKMRLVKQGHDKQGNSSNTPAPWADPALPEGSHIDSAHAEALVQQLSQLRVESVLGTAARPEWQQEHPVLTMGLRDDKNQTVEWTLSKPATGDFYVLKSSAHPWYFSVSSALAKSIVDAGGRDALIVAGKTQAQPSGKS